MRKLVAHDHREAYDYRATYYDDPALMADRDEEATRFKIANVVARLPLQADSRVLDVGPGDGRLFQMVAPRVARCCGVDPSPSAVGKLTELFEGHPNVEFAVGLSDQIPYGDEEFDVVVMNSVLLILPSREAVERTLTELIRTCRIGGTVFIGEVPFRDEMGSGILRLLARKVRDLGVAGIARHLYCVYLRPVLRGEPLLVMPFGKTLHFEPEDFMEMCRRHGTEVECLQHREPRRASTTRNDYVLTLGSHEQ